MSDDIQNLLAKLDFMTDDISQAVAAQMQLETKRIQADAKRLAPVDSGRLRYSITTDVKRDDADIVGTVGTNVSYAPIVEFGSGPVGEASPKMLPDGVNPSYRQDGWTYKDPKTGNFHRTEGQPAKPFLYPAFKHNEATVTENMAKAVAQGVKEGAGNG